MMSLILQSYLTVLLSVAIGAGLVFALGVYFIFKKKSRKKTPDLKVITTEPRHKQATVTLYDISAIAGDDVLTTQLDLARAYIETGKTKLAKKILADVMAKGNEVQQQEAKHLSGAC